MANWETFAIFHKMEGLDLAEKAFARAIAIDPLDQEKQSLRSFCNLNLKKRELSGGNTDARKVLRDEIKVCKQGILDFMGKQDLNVMALTKEQYTNAQSILPEGIPMIPLYCRFMRTNKDSTITPDIVEDAIDSVTRDDIEEHKGLVEAIVAKVRLGIRSYTTSIKLTDSKERNQALYECPEVPQSMYDLLIRMHIATHRLSEAQGSNKEQISEVSSEINKIKQSLFSFFERTGATSQRVVLNDKSYRIAKKVSVRHERIGIGKLQTILQENEVKNLDEMKKKVRHVLSNLPPVTKTDIVFTALRT